MQGGAQDPWHKALFLGPYLTRSGPVDIPYVVWMMPSYIIRFQVSPCVHRGPPIVQAKFKHILQLHYNNNNNNVLHVQVQTPKCTILNKRTFYQTA